MNDSLHAAGGLPSPAVVTPAHTLPPTHLELLPRACREPGRRRIERPAASVAVGCCSVIGGVVLLVLGVLH
jgi:hypothetical protein